MRPHAPVHTAAVLAFAFVTVATATSIAQDYETPPDQAAAQALPAEVLAGPEHSVADPVRSDGVMNRYALVSRFGSYDVHGRALLAIRIQEIGALAELDRVSKSEVFLKAVGRSVTAPLQTAVDFVEKPVETVTGVPRGVANLFKTYRLKAREATGKAKEAAGKAKSAADGTSEDRKDTLAKAGEKAMSEAKSYALRHLGVTSAERLWYAKLGVDPYTTNEPLRVAVTRVARIDATAQFGLRFAGIPSIPGIDIARQGMDAIWQEDPLVIRDRNRRFLKSLGLDEEERRRFEDNVALSPMHQLTLLQMARTLAGVGERGELIRRALDVSEEEEALALIDSVALLVRLHGESPLAEIVGGIRLPAARTRDGRLVVCAGFDALYWTERVADGARQIALAYRDAAASERQFRLAGTASPRLRTEVESLGWKVHDNAGASAAPARSKT